MRSHAHLVGPSILRHRDLASFQQRSAARVESGETLVAVTDEGALLGIAVIKPSKFGGLKQTIGCFSHQLAPPPWPPHYMPRSAWGRPLNLMVVLVRGCQTAVYRLMWPAADHLLSQPQMIPRSSSSLWVKGSKARELGKGYWPPLNELLQREGAVKHTSTPLLETMQRTGSTSATAGGGARALSSTRPRPDPRLGVVAAARYRSGAIALTSG